jgi:4-carboxymuconolactone decarboxylase
MSNYPTPRMGPLPEASMSAEQRKVAAALIAGPRGRVAGPFIAMLRSPVFMDRAQSLGAYLRYDSVIEPRLSELTILLTSHYWQQNFEFTAHKPIALKAGVAQSTIDSILDGQTFDRLPKDEALLFEAVETIFWDKSFDDNLYAQLVAEFGENGVIDLLGIIGYYSMLAMILNVTRTALPDGVKNVFPFP